MGLQAQASGFYIYVYIHVYMSTYMSTFEQGVGMMNVDFIIGRGIWQESVLWLRAGELVGVRGVFLPTAFP